VIHFDMDGMGIISKWRIEVGHSERFYMDQ